MTLSLVSDVPSPMLRLTGVSKRYAEILANDQIDLAVGKGEIHALLGENGAGKSTLVRIIYGLSQPSAGELAWMGEKVVIANPREARRLGIGMVMQHFSLVEALTVADNIALALDERISRSELRRRIERLSSEYGMTIELDRRVADLSMGERQRVEILRALMSDPRLLIMDEPTSVLTPQEVDDLFSVLRRVKASGRSVLYISHKLHEVIAICERVTVLRAGRKVSSALVAKHDTRSLAEMMLGQALGSIRPPTASTSGPQRLAVSGLTTRPEDGFGTPLDDVNFTVAAGEILGVAGIAGNGQLALHAALAGERTVTGLNTIKLNGEDIATLGPVPRRRRGLRAVPEERHEHGAVSRLDLIDNIALTQWERKEISWVGYLRRSGLHSEAESIISHFDVRTAGVHALAGALSGGNLQKFIIGREIQQNPSLLVVSQPTWGVDAGAAVIIHQALLDLASNGAAVIVISQDLDELLSISTSLAVLAEGRLSRARPTLSYTVTEIGQLMSGNSEAMLEAGRAQ